jgi:hypothetical protein
MIIRKTRTKNSEEKATALHNAQKPHVACAALHNLSIVPRVQAGLTIFEVSRSVSRY